uniref:Uncharacterized protein n=1 Tax=Euplotes harpa TaxID=151035 RepID=A0A7S3J1I3_9SPIT|mmetsp:Transcript_1448/g.1681  ORF Transcript_1448/g.1681 Transcript_1448/m.1681 type:complete len:131 (+) Transcript_1448:62-454(+)
MSGKSSKKKEAKRKSFNEFNFANILEEDDINGYQENMKVNDRFALAKTNSMRPASFHDQNNVLIDSMICFNYRKETSNKNKDVLDETLGFPNYINAINAYRNPDIITGDATKFLKGNKYRSKVANRNEEK